MTAAISSSWTIGSGGSVFRLGRAAVRVAVGERGYAKVDLVCRVCQRPFRGRRDRRTCSKACHGRYIGVHFSGDMKPSVGGAFVWRGKERP